MLVSHVLVREVLMGKGSRITQLFRAKADILVRAVAQGLDLGSAADAEGNSVPGLQRLAIGTFYRD